MGLRASYDIWHSDVYGFSQHSGILLLHKQQRLL